MSDTFKVRSPAKLILSGEHAVLYGQPAIAMAVNYYTETVISWHKEQVINFNLLNLEYAKGYTLYALNKLKLRIQKNYRAFLRGKCGIKDVLKKPFELLQYSVSNLIEKLNLQLTKGLEIQINSNIPIGCGMGSSAAAIVSTMHAISCLFNLKLEAKKLLSLGQDIEDLQHGKSSGLDLHLTLFGGVVKFYQGDTEPRHIPDTSYLYAVNTGSPQTTTGESVIKVAKYFTSGKLGEDFGAVTNALDVALRKNNLLDIQNAIKENHKLLNTIGVVPKKVYDFIAAIQQQKGAAKICGAGSVVGEEGGMVLVVSEHDLSSVAKKFNYHMQLIQVDYHGTKLI